MSHHIVFDFESIKDKLQESYVIIGDTIEYCPANQEGWVLYSVIEKDGYKALKYLYDYYTQLD